MAKNSTNISTKQTTTSHLIRLNTKRTTTDDVGNLGPRM